MDQQLLIENGVDVENSIKLLGDKKTYDDLLMSFLVESETRVQDIKVFKETADMANYAILAHAMKSDSKYLGFTKLAELSLQHELESRNTNVSYINEHFDELMNEFHRIIVLVDQYLGKGIGLNE
jgi:HPt (histidine-containing phosphotransfer) domain-containing protein